MKWEKSDTTFLSVIVPVYNCKKYLRAAVKSVLKEGFPGLEVLVIDDGSTDGSLQEISDLSVRRIVLSKNSGQACAQNIGVANSKGRFVAFLDADDLFAKDSIKWRFEWLLDNTDEMLVAGRMAGVINSDGKFLGSYQEVLNPHYRRPPSFITENYLRSGGEFPSQTWLMCFHKQLLQMVGPFDETLKCAHDNDYFYRILKRTAIPFVDRPVVYYRLHQDNLSGQLQDGKFVYYKRNIAENLMVHLAHGITPKN